MARTWPDTETGKLLRQLERHYGKLARPRFAGPFEMVLWEIIAYLADDDRRDLAYSALREKVGVAPQQILAAPPALLREITRMGGSIAADERAERLQMAAQLVMDDFVGDLSEVLKLPPQKAKKLLMQFPMIGEPGAEKILLFFGVSPVLALDSNGVRALVRLGIAEERKSYAATYKSIREVTLEQLPADCQLLWTAHSLLRQHGKELCLRNGPVCGACPVARQCSYFQIRVSPASI